MSTSVRSLVIMLTLLVMGLIFVVPAFAQDTEGNSPVVHQTTSSPNCGWVHPDGTGDQIGTFVGGSCEFSTMSNGHVLIDRVEGEGETADGQEGDLNYMFVVSPNDRYVYPSHSIIEDTDGHGRLVCNRHIASDQNGNTTVRYQGNSC
jgi:hypothetical protein